VLKGVGDGFTHGDDDPVGVIAAHIP